MWTEAGGLGEGATDPLLGDLGRFEGQLARGVADVRSVQSVEKGPEQGDADGCADLAGRVVQRGGDTLLVLRQRRRDRSGRWAHHQTDTERQDQQARQHRDISPVHLDQEAEQGQPGGEQQQARRHDVAIAEPVSKRRSDCRERHHEHRHREQAGGGMKGGVAEDRLEQLDQHEKQHEHETEDHDEVDRAGGKAAVTEQPQVEQRVLESQLESHEGNRRDGADQQTGQGHDAGPSPLGPLLDAEHNPAHRHSRQHRTGDVEAGFYVLTGMGNNHGAGDQRAQAQERGHREHPWPGRVVDDCRRSEEAENAPRSRESGPYADRPGTLARREARGDDRQGHRHDHCGPDAGEHSQRDQLARAVCEGGRHIGCHKDQKAAQQNRLAAPAVADRTNRKQHRRQNEGVAVDHPQQLALRCTQIGGDRLLCDIEPGDRRHHANQRRAHRNEDPLPFARVGNRLVVGVRIGGIEEVGVVGVQEGGVHDLCFS